MNILNLILLIAEGFSFPPGTGTVIKSISKVRILRLLFLIQLRYQDCFEMKVIFSAVVKNLPYVVSMLKIYPLFYASFFLFFIKLYKEDEYFCDNVEFDVSTKEECFNCGGDWVKFTCNFSWLFTTIVEGTGINTMEGWIYGMMRMMDLSGKDRTPTYNSNEHIQIFYVFLHFIGAIILFNFIVSMMLINYRKVKEHISGEKYLN